MSAAPPNKLGIGRTLDIPEAELRMPIVEKILPDDCELETFRHSPGEARIEPEVVRNRLKASRLIFHLVDIPKRHVPFERWADVERRSQLNLLLRIEQFTATLKEVLATFLDADAVSDQRVARANAPFGRDLPGPVELQTINPSLGIVLRDEWGTRRCRSDVVVFARIGGGGNEGLVPEGVPPAEFGGDDLLRVEI